MYCGYDLKFITEDTLDGDRYYESCYEDGLKRFLKQKKEINNILEDFALNNGTLDGSAMQKNWFPLLKSDIFISHSHSDNKAAIILSELLWKRFQLTAFIDSCVWGYSNDLLKQIDDIYCLNDNGGIYNYTKRNYSTSHVHMMLLTALMMMIDNCECMFFLDTPNSINTEDIINECTNSPWIYSEINISRLIKRRFSKRQQKQRIQESLQKSSTENFSLKIKYELNKSHFSELTEDNFISWLETYDEEKHPLDVLYELVPPEKRGVIYG